MGALQREYDRFGPWVVELSDDDPPPRLFAPHLPGGGVPLLAVKIPRHIERRVARPGMDLYDYVVAVYADELVVLRRVGTEVASDRWRIGELQELRITQDLLRGNLRLGLPAGRWFDVPFSTVSRALMDRLVDLLRERYRPAGSGRTPPPGRTVPEGVLGYYFSNLLKAERRSGAAMHVVAWQGTRAVASRSRHSLRRLANRVTDKRLLESLHLSDGAELKIRTRGAPYAYRWQTVYGLETTYIPVDNVLEAAWREDPLNGATVLVLRTASSGSEFVFADDNEATEAYAGYLAGLTKRASRP